MNERVIVLHGFGAPSWCVNLLTRRLSGYDFDASRWSYPSMTRPIDALAADFAAHIESIAPGETLHLVAHSMGTAIVRASLGSFGVDRIAKFVFLSPPIIGTPLANLAPAFLQTVFPPLFQLRIDQDSYVRNLPLPPPERLAVIAGRFDVHVPLRWTRSPLIRHHLTLNLTHNGMLISRRAAAATASFLRGGSLT